MDNKTDIDFSRLVGFAQVSDRVADGVDFQNEAFDSRLGAKIGVGEATAPLAVDVVDDAAGGGEDA